MDEYDIEQFERLFKRCYPVAVYGRKKEPGLFSFDDALEVFLVYFRDYEYFMKRSHPPLARGKICAIIQCMDWVPSDESFDNGAVELFPGDYPDIIRQHLAATGNRHPPGGVMRKQKSRLWCVSTKNGRREYYSIRFSSIPAFNFSAKSIGTQTFVGLL